MPDLKREIVVSDTITIIQRVEEKTDIATISSEAALLNKIINAVKNVETAVAGVMFTTPRKRSGPGRRKKELTNADKQLILDYEKHNSSNERMYLVDKYGFRDYGAMQKGYYYRKRKQIALRKEPRGTQDGEEER